MKPQNHLNAQSAVRAITVAAIHAGAAKRFFQVAFLT
jgi:hypothetical protein